MLKNVKKGKILLSLIASILMMVLFGNLYSLATEENTSNTPVTITPTTNGGNSNTNNSGNTNTENRASIVATANNTANNSNVANNNTNTNNTANNNTSIYNNTNNTSNSSGLPYTGTNSKSILLMVVFAISAVYAYKKVSDYNV